MTNRMRIFTGSPYNFSGTEEFFTRESGLLSRGFQFHGIDSEVVTLGPAEPGDSLAMHRGSWEQLEDPEWWEALALDALVFIAWGNHRYGSMIRAASAAGVRVAQVTDTQGLAYPLADPAAHLRSEEAHYWYEPRWKQVARTVCKLPITLTARIAYRDLRDARAMIAGDFFIAPTPLAAKRFKTVVRRLVGTKASEKVRFVPFPVNPTFSYSQQIAKEDEVVAVGRWDSTQKRTPLLINTISLALKARSRTRFRIFGHRSSELEAWHRSLASEFRARVDLEGLVPSAAIADAYRRARVILVSSAYEGCHNASAEAVCSGVSVVGCRSPYLGVLEWHASRDSGNLADEATPDALAATLDKELSLWDCGDRDPVAISRSWTQELHAENVASQMLKLFSELGLDAQP